MRIGIKYCGGCNPRYDRRELSQKIISRFNEVDFLAAQENKDYDAVIIICGCTSACAAHKNLKTKEKIFIKSEDELDKVMEKIEELIISE